MIFGKLRIKGHSMEPTIKNGQTIFVSSLPYCFKKPKRNDIVALKKDDSVFVKRISKIENNTYFVMGDNVHDSMDSRRFGAIQEKHIMGKVLGNY